MQHRSPRKDHFASSIFLIAMLSLLGLEPSLAQSRQRSAAASTRPSMPDKQKTFLFLRGKLLSMEPEGSPSKIKDITFDDATCILQMRFENGNTGSIRMGLLDASTGVWSIIDRPAEGGRTASWLRLTFQPTPGNQAFLVEQQGGKTTERSEGAFFFSLMRIADAPETRQQITNASKHLIALCGGIPDTNAF